LNSNATAIHFHVGNGTHGHLALTIFSAACWHLPPSSQQPTSPAPPSRPAGSTGATITEINCQHLVSQATYRNLLIAVVPLIYIKTLYNTIPLDGEHHLPQLLHHIWATHGTMITSTELKASLLYLSKEPWTTELPIKTFFTQLKKGITFPTTGHAPITHATAVHAGYTIIADTSLYKTRCQDWCTKPFADQTYFGLPPSLLCH
jgi:hypothetical protein